MNILIVEDYESLATILREFVIRRATQLNLAVTVLEATTLVTALNLLPQADGVLCDGTFPYMTGAQPVCNWESVSELARDWSIPFVLFSADDMAVKLAKARGILAFHKLKSSPRFQAIDVLLAEIAGQNSSGDIY